MSVVSVVTDALAQELEGKKLWRRAAARWLALTGSGAWSDEELDWIRRRRNYCHAMIVRADDEKLDIAAVNRAAGQALKRMGISRPRGMAFRLPVQSVADDMGTDSPGLYMQGTWMHNDDQGERTGLGMGLGLPLGDFLLSGGGKVLYLNPESEGEGWAMAMGGATGLVDDAAYDGICRRVLLPGFAVRRC